MTNNKMNSLASTGTFNSCSYEQNVNMDITQDQGYQSLKLKDNTPQFNKDWEDVLNEPLFDTDGQIWENNAPTLLCENESSVNTSSFPLTTNQDSIESVESLICPPVATASTGKEKDANTFIKNTILKLYN